MHSHVLFLGLVSLAVLAIAGWIFCSRILRLKVSVRGELRKSSHRSPRPQRAKKVEETASEPPPRR